MATKAVGIRTSTSTFSGDLVSTLWRFNGDGTRHLDYAYRHDGPVNVLGVGFDLPNQAVTGMRCWCGQGPYRVWKNRMVGGTPDVWDLESSNSETGFAGWIYPETKSCYADVRWLTLRTAAG